MCPEVVAVVPRLNRDLPSFAIIMSDDTRKIKRKLSALASSLDDLETGLSALLSQPLPEMVLGLETIQQAKLQVVIPYLVYDLVFGPSYILSHLCTQFHR